MRVIAFLLMLFTVMFTSCSGEREKQMDDELKKSAAAKDEAIEQLKRQNDELEKNNIETAKVNEEIQNKKNIVIKNFTDYVKASIKSDSRTFGGLKNIVVSISNSSNYQIDNIVFEVEILDYRDQLIRSYHANSKVIIPGGTTEIALSNEDRGDKVSVKFVEVESEQLGINTRIDK